MNKIRLAGVVVFYNPNNSNIDNINNYLDEVDKLYVVDNSEDEVIRIKDNKKIEYIKYRENKGIAYALNDAAKNAIKDGYKYLLTLDQDSEMNSSILKQMKKFLNDNQDNNIGLISPYQDIDTNDEIPTEEYTDIVEIMTSGNIINLDAYQKIHGFKDWLFIDHVDTEYCMNLHKNNYKVLRLNHVVMKHHLGNYTIRHLLKKEYRLSNHSPIRRYYMVRNALYIRKMYHDIYPDYTEFLIRIQKGQAKRILVFEHQKIKKLYYMYKGYKDFKRGKKGKIN